MNCTLLEKLQITSICNFSIVARAIDGRGRSMNRALVARPTGTLVCCAQCHQVPFTSMTMSVASSQRDRDTITALRMFFEVRARFCFC